VTLRLRRDLPTDAQAWRQATIVFVIFLLAQALDGILTYVGVSHLGIGIEANVLLATWMHLVGAEAALVGAKLMACACGYLLYRTAWHRPLAITAGLCLGVAVIPWIGIVATLLFTV
jgi:uncharacterized membrane protein